MIIEDWDCYTTIRRNLCHLKVKLLQLNSKGKDSLLVSFELLDVVPADFNLCETTFLFSLKAT